MKRTIGNFLTQSNKDFPADCELFDSMQANTAMAAIIGNVAGDKAILFGCDLEQNGTRRAQGYVFLRTVDFPEGEILFWEGGPVSGGIYVKLVDVSVTAQGYEFPKAYTVRSLSPGIGSENYSWGDFKTLQTIQQLQDKDAQQDSAIAALTPPPLGLVQMWAGAVTGGSLPNNYAFCDGAQVLQTDYPELYAVIGRLHTPSTIPAGYFCLPDLRSRFVTGYNSGDGDYNAIAKTGGSKTVSLTADQIPEHSHSVNDYYYIETRTSGALDGYDTLPQKSAGTGDSDNDNLYLWYKTHDTKDTGGNASHENRPPYYTLAYIIRVK